MRRVHVVLMGFLWGFCSPGFCFFLKPVPSFGRYPTLFIYFSISLFDLVFHCMIKSSIPRLLLFHISPGSACVIFGSSDKTDSLSYDPWAITRNSPIRRLTTAPPKQSPTQQHTQQSSRRALRLSDPNAYAHAHAHAHRYIRSRHAYCTITLPSPSPTVPNASRGPAKPKTLSTMPVLVLLCTPSHTPVLLAHTLCALVPPVCAAYQHNCGRRRGCACGAVSRGRRRVSLVPRPVNSLDLSTAARLSSVGTGCGCGKRPSEKGVAEQ